MGRSVLAVLIALCLGGCTQTASPFSADLQRRALDMTADVIAWDAAMHTATKPVPIADVNATLSKWEGQVAAMAQLSASIDPATIDCDKVSATVMKGVKPLLPKSMADTLPAQAPDTEAAGTPRGCEGSLIDTLADDLRNVRRDIATHCDAPQLLPAGDAAEVPNPPSRAGGRSATATGDAIIMTRPCRAWFGGGQFGSGGLIVYRLVRDLGAIVYIEGRKKPAT
jgi:hypothetical protein